MKNWDLIKLSCDFILFVSSVIFTVLSVQTKQNLLEKKQINLPISLNNKRETREKKCLEIRNSLEKL